MLGFFSLNIVGIGSITGAGTKGGIGTKGRIGTTNGTVVSESHILKSRNIYQNILRCRFQGGIGLSSSVYVLDLIFFLMH